MMVWGEGDTPALRESYRCQRTGYVGRVRGGGRVTLSAGGSGGEIMDGHHRLQDLQISQR